ncbi:putative coenzyme A-disulfide reductase [Gordonia hirsuta DSM 44140 = NBRC 16056]|uniref:Putative coenzyme A-disulfide reductase n=1 Tax=Gordonia hirsuta DSM 44140 = NBRC 16056 TaxID=1121927 RepID=L7L5K9_9ACTN|nr:FAD-dependent oxidoreductase [Gordonia hirsuta]GAC56229.1 putative coenzyme A-disulfide reductase [Gordonia hirsuta DSM 44140 = NBRC 16056]
MRIVVVGGVAGGMSAAARARRLDENAEIIVFERGEHPSFANCGLPYYVSGEIEQEQDLLVQTPESLRETLAIDVRVRHDVIGVDPAAKTVLVRNADGVSTVAYDELILSPGAVANRPPIPGLDSPRVQTLRTVGDAVRLKDTVTDGATRAVVLGAGFIGLEAAEGLRLQGLTVDIVELAAHVLPALETEIASLVTAELRDNLGITVHDCVSATAIETGPVRDVVVLSDGTRLPADVVVLSVGVTPDTAVFAEAGVETERGAIVVDGRGHTNLDGIWAVGDATVSTDAVTGLRRPVPLAGPANRAGRQVADHILTPERARPIPATVGTAIVRAGGLTAAMTGANRAALAGSDNDYFTVHLHPANHAGYFPGAEQIHMLMHVRTSDGLILGAQAVGLDGVDKRIDVLATAIRNRMTAPELIDLDLAYAPPYGSAKDPVNLAGMIAENVLDGELKLWYAEQLDADDADDYLILDVRNQDEYDQDHLPGAMLVPGTQVRERLEEIREAAAGRPIRVHCASGKRSYLACRTLTAAGLEAANLSGGLETLRALIPGEPALV